MLPAEYLSTLSYFHNLCGIINTLEHVCKAELITVQVSGFADGGKLLRGSVITL